MRMPDLRQADAFLDALRLTGNRPRCFWVLNTETKKSFNTDDLSKVERYAAANPSASVYMVPAVLREIRRKGDAVSREAADLADAQYMALIAEHDDLSPEESIAKVDGSGLPAPSFRVSTGNKSIHHWWVLKQPITQEQFVAGQTRLAAFLESDPKVNCPTQVMRVPGFENGKTGRMAEMFDHRTDIFDLTDSYLYEELMAVVPEIQQPPPAPAEVVPMRQKKTGAVEWFPLLSDKGQYDCMVDLLGHVWEATADVDGVEVPDSHQKRMTVMAGIVNQTGDPRTVSNIWKEAAQMRGFSWDKSTKPDAYSWAVELLRGQQKREGQWQKSGANAYGNTIGSAIAVAVGLGWKSNKYRKALSNDADHLQKLIFNELFEGGEGWSSFGGETYRRMGNHWQLVSEAMLERQVADYLASQEEYASKSNTSNIKGCAEYMRIRTATEASPNPDGYVNCTNGILEIKPGGHRVLYDHDDPAVADLVFLDEPQLTYDPNADRTHAEKLLECLPDPKGRALYMRAVAFPLNFEAAAARHGHSIAIFSQGEGSNGKNTLNNLVEKIYGASACPGIPLSEFNKADKDGSFMMHFLSRARMNMPAETSCAFKIDNLKTLKAVTTGDSIMGERKGIDAFAFKPKLTQLYPTNNEFIMNNIKEADERRYYVMEWPISYTSDLAKIQRDPGHFKPKDARYLGFGENHKWVLENVLPGFFNIMLEYYEEVCQKGFEDLRDYSRRITDHMGEAVNHVKEFWADLGLVPYSGTMDENSVTLRQLWERYQEYCHMLGRANVLDEDLDGSKIYKMLPTTQGSDKTCATPAELYKRISEVRGVAISRMNQNQAKKLGVPRDYYLTSHRYPDA